MKSLKKILVFIFIAIIVTGCSMKAEYNMSIKKDKSMDFAIIMGFDDELIEGMMSMENSSSEEEYYDEDNTTKEYTDEEKWTYLESNLEESDDKTPEELGFKKERYDQDGYKGFKYTKTISNIDNISGETANFDLNEFEKISDSVVFTKTENKYKANFVLENENSESAEGMNVDFDIKFVVTLPNKAISHNATEVSKDGKTLTWDLSNSESKNIMFEFDFKENNDMLLYIEIGAGILIVLIIVVLVIVFTNKKKNNNKTNSMNVQPQVNQPVNNVTDSVNVQPQVNQPVNNVTDSVNVQPQMNQPINNVTDSIDVQSQVNQPINNVTDSVNVQSQVNQPVNNVTDSINVQPQVNQPVNNVTDSVNVQPQMNQPVNNVTDSINVQPQVNQSVNVLNNQYTDNNEKNN